MPFNTLPGTSDAPRLYARVDSNALWCRMKKMAEETKAVGLQNMKLKAELRRVSQQSLEWLNAMKKTEEERRKTKDKLDDVSGEWCCVSAAVKSCVVRFLREDSTQIRRERVSWRPVARRRLYSRKRMPSVCQSFSLLVLVLPL